MPILSWKQLYCIFNFWLLVMYFLNYLWIFETNDNLPNRTAQEELTEQLRIGFINMEAILFYVARNVTAEFMEMFNISDSKHFKLTWIF